MIIRKNLNILILGLGPTQGSDDTKLTAEDPYSINFSISNRRFCLSLHYNGSNSFLFVNATRIYQLKAKDSEIKLYPLSLGNTSGHFSANNMEKTGLNGCVYDFSVDYKIFDTCLMKKYNIK